MIPPPTEADLAIDHERAYQCSHLLVDPGGEVVRSFIRLLAAERAEVARLEVFAADAVEAAVEPLVAKRALRGRQIAVLVAALERAEFLVARLKSRAFAESDRTACEDFLREASTALRDPIA